MDTAILDIIVTLRGREAALSAELKEVRQEIEERSPDIVDAMLRDGMRSTQRNGKTLYLRSTKKAYVKDMDGLIRRLRRRGMGSMVKTQVNYQTITAYVREIMEDGGTVPASVAACLDIHDEISIRVRN